MLTTQRGRKRIVQHRLRPRSVSICPFIRKDQVGMVLVGKPPEKGYSMALGD